MRNHLPTLLAAAIFGVGTIATLTASAANADPATATTPSTRAERRAEFQQRLLDKIDTNHDGVVSRDEYKAWIDSRFDQMDANHDGSITADEIASSPAAAERVHKRAEGMIKHLDSSGTGTVTRSDFEAKGMARFDRLGGGADTLTADQLMPRMGMHRRGKQADDSASPTQD